KLGILWPAWSKADITASGIMISSMFGAGGGNEVANGNALRALKNKFGEEKALALFNDLRLMHASNAIFQSNSENCFPRYENNLCEQEASQLVDPSALAILDEVTEVSELVNGNNLLTQKHKLPSASNFLIAGSAKMADGHPALAGGPQTGYVSPELLMEIELNGGGYRATGMTVPGIAMLVLVGHTDHYGWSITAGASDLVDLRAEKLCEPDGSAATQQSDHYWFKQQCIPFVKGKTKRTLDRSVHGPIIAYGTVQGEPVAISHQRASRGFEADAAVSLRRLNFGEVENAADFPKALDEIPYSMNWGYLNNHEIAYMHTGHFPIRKVGVSANLPSWGTGEWEWQGYLPLAQKAFEVNPEKNYVTSWNNRVAPNWATSDDDWGTGNYHRIEMLESRIKEASQLTVLALNEKVLDAATEDHHASVLLSRLEKLVPLQTAPSEQLKNMMAFLQQWRST
ncbi:MAG TPA: penicillin acylase family protein, partial [Pseudomonadales bacterium]|nr:penicillin acylase family protein [Pseudomonadales bacterium]